MSTSIERYRMSDMTPFQEAAAWATGAAATAAGALTVWSKLMRNFSSDGQSIHNDKTSKQLYDLLVNENKRVDDRNRELEIRNDAMNSRLQQLEITHAQLLLMTNENQSLKAIVKSKSDQLTMLLRQQRKDREEASIQLREYERTITHFTLKISHLENLVMTQANTPTRRVEDHLAHVPNQLEFPNE